MSIPPLLVKCLELTQSDHDGEALNAIRKANQLLKKSNLTWTALLNGHGTGSTSSSSGRYQEQTYNPWDNYGFNKAKRERDKQQDAHAEWQAKQQAEMHAAWEKMREQNEELRKQEAAAKKNEIQEMFNFLRGKPYPPRIMELLRSFDQWFREKNFLTPKQTETLRDIYNARKLKERNENGS